MNRKCIELGAIHIVKYNLNTEVVNYRNLLEYRLSDVYDTVKRSICIAITHLIPFLHEHQLYLLNDWKPFFTFCFDFHSEEVRCYFFQHTAPVMLQFIQDNEIMYNAEFIKSRFELKEYLKAPISVINCLAHAYQVISSIPKLFDALGAKDWYNQLAQKIKDSEKNMGSHIDPFFALFARIGAQESLLQDTVMFLLSYACSSNAVSQAAAYWQLRHFASGKQVSLANYFKQFEDVIYSEWIPNALKKNSISSIKNFANCIIDLEYEKVLAQVGFQCLPKWVMMQDAENVEVLKKQYDALDLEEDIIMMNLEPIITEIMVSTENNKLHEYLAFLEPLIVRAIPIN